MSVQLISETRPVARKPHVCDNCGHDIPKGVRYLRQFCVDGGDAWSWVSHEDCMEAVVYLDSLSKYSSYDGLAPISEYENNSGESLDFLRGYWPHVVCRLDFWKQKQKGDTP